MWGLLPLHACIGPIDAEERQRQVAYIAGDKADGGWCYSLDPVLAHTPRSSAGADCRILSVCRFKREASCHDLYASIPSRWKKYNDLHYDQYWLVLWLVA